MPRGPPREEGIVPGGGVAFLRAIEAVENAKTKARGDEKIGFEIVAEALRWPTQQIADNAGEDGEVVVDEILKNKNPAWGYDAANGRIRRYAQGRGSSIRPRSPAPRC